MLPFLLLPTIGGAIGGLLAFDWRIAIAAIAGGLGMLFLPFIGYDFDVLVALSAGIAVGAFIGLLLIVWQGTPYRWARMTWGLLGTFTLHVTLVVWNLGS
ncbi:hypothetical protein [Pseudaestuariivita atlantica]|nr:hypothetical protein [Pseudaestuariivita atlantica]